MKLYDVALSIGHNVNGTPSHDQQTIIKALLEVMNKGDQLIEGFSAYDMLGYWCSEIETSTRIEINGASDEIAQAIRERIPELARYLKQYEIYFDIRQSTSRAICCTEDVQTVELTA